MFCIDFDLIFDFDVIIVYNLHYLGVTAIYKVVFDVANLETAKFIPYVSIIYGH